MTAERARPVVDGIQRHLEAIYDLSVDLRARDFLIGDRERRALVEAGLAPAEGPQEELLVLEEAGETSLALYLSDGVIRRLGEGPGLQEHCHATEGVSHFLLVAWSAAQQRRLRPLDLELQAEVDKACTVLLLDRAATGGRGGRRLLGRLFADVSFDDRLDAEELHRYRTAHRTAARYAHRLADLLDRGVEHLLEELRGFYRLGGEAKRRRALAA